MHYEKNCLCIILKVFEQLTNYKWSVFDKPSLLAHNCLPSKQKTWGRIRQDMQVGIIIILSTIILPSVILGIWLPLERCLFDRSKYEDEAILLCISIAHLERTYLCLLHAKEKQKFDFVKIREKRVITIILYPFNNIKKLKQSYKKGHETPRFHLSNWIIWRSGCHNAPLVKCINLKTISKNKLRAF